MMFAAVACASARSPTATGRASSWAWGRWSRRCGMALLCWRVDADVDYLTDLLPGLLVFGARAVDDRGAADVHRAGRRGREQRRDRVGGEQRDRARGRAGGDRGGGGGGGGVLRHAARGRARRAGADAARGGARGRGGEASSRSRSCRSRACRRTCEASVREAAEDASVARVPRRHRDRDRPGGPGRRARAGRDHQPAPPGRRRRMPGRPARRPAARRRRASRRATGTSRRAGGARRGPAPRRGRWRRRPPGGPGETSRIRAPSAGARAAPGSAGLGCAPWPSIGAPSSASAPPARSAGAARPSRGGRAPEARRPGPARGRARAGAASRARPATTRRGSSTTRATTASGRRRSCSRSTRATCRRSSAGRTASACAWSPARRPQLRRLLDHRGRRRRRPQPAARHPRRRAGRATVGAGAQLIDVYSKLARRGLLVPAGSCPRWASPGSRWAAGTGCRAAASG